MNGLFVHNTSNDLDHDLMDALNSMGMNDKPSPQNEYPLKTSIILEDGNDMALHEPRPSVENHSSSRDLMAHMHGLTPMPKPPLRRPRLSMGSVATNGTCSKFSAASPFPPAPLSTIGKNAQMKCFTHEFVETPMMKPTGWGSCPVEGRDWGASDDCEEGITQELIQRLNQALLESGMLTGDVDQRSLLVLRLWLTLCSSDSEQANLTNSRISLTMNQDRSPWTWNLKLRVNTGATKAVLKVPANEMR